MSGPSTEKRRIGTVEGVALILSVLACLILFLKILPNLHENADFYETNLVRLQERLDRAEVEIMNLRDSADTLNYHREVGAIRDALDALDGLESRLPPAKTALIDKVREDFEALLEELKDQ